MKNYLEKYQKYFGLEKSYFWLANQYKFAMAFARPLFKIRQKSEKFLMLDAGCGSGNLIDYLIPYGKVKGIDNSWESCLLCRKKYGLQVSQASIENLPFVDNTFDFIFAIEVIEHINDDVGALRELYRVLKPKGFLIVTMPAFMCLWGYHDEKLGHLRRYTKYHFHQVVDQTSFVIKEYHYFKSLFFLPLLIFRMTKRITTNESDDFYKINLAINYLLHKLLDFEMLITRVIGLPIGASLFAILQKK